MKLHKIPQELVQPEDRKDPKMEFLVLQTLDVGEKEVAKETKKEQLEEAVSEDRASEENT